MGEQTEKILESEWNTDLNEALTRYRNHSGPGTYADVLSVLLQGIQEDKAAVFPAGLFD